MRRRPLVVLVLGAWLAAWTSPAAAHGPCGCTFPEVAEAGASLRTGTAYRIIWNPAPKDFRGQTSSTRLASGYRADAPTKTVFQRPKARPKRRPKFKIPGDTPPGIYFVLIFDGSEGGHHTTWDYVQVPGAPPDSGSAIASRSAVDSAAEKPPIGLIAGLAGAALVAVALAIRRRNARSRVPLRRGPTARPAQGDR